MRELTSTELMLIAGGSGECEGDQDESVIVVCGEVPEPPYYPPPYYPPPYYPPPYSPPPSYGGGGGTPSYADWLQDECDADLAVDVTARQIEAMIKAQPDWDEREYGAVIYVTGSGETKIGPLTTGMTVAEAAAEGLDAPRTVIQPPADLEGGFIVGIVHNHPDEGYSDAADLLNQYPSDYLNDDGTPGGDYGMMDSLIGSGMAANDPRFANSAAFAMYILGPDGILREFNKSDGRVDPSSDPDADDRANLYSDRPCQS